MISKISKMHWQASGSTGLLSLGQFGSLSLVAMPSLITHIHMDELTQIYQWLQPSKRQDELHLANPASVLPWSIIHNDVAVAQSVLINGRYSPYVIKIAENDLLWYPESLRRQSKRALKQVNLSPTQIRTLPSVSVFQKEFVELRDSASNDFSSFQARTHRALQELALKAFAPEVKTQKPSLCGENIK